MDQLSESRLDVLEDEFERIVDGPYPQWTNLWNEEHAGIEEIYGSLG